jgi:alpha-beta hydrolase superfamily lysophospholipase
MLSFVPSAAPAPRAARCCSSSAAPPPGPGRALVPLLAALIAILSEAASVGLAQPAAREPEPLPAVKELTLETSDGIGLAVQYFAAPGEDKPEATVILIHDLGGSSDAVVPLAETLQQAGYAVLAPDLRGHGESSIPPYAKAAATGEQWKLVKRPDFEAMAVTGGGRVRGQGDIRGDIETVRNWIKQQAAAGKLDLDRIVVVGSGVGAAVAATWTVADAGWPPLASGPQGGQVKGLVLVDPAFATKGFSIGPALAKEPLRTMVPVLILAGSGSRDAGKVFDQLKRQRPTAWFDSRNPSPAKDSEASLLFVEVAARDKRGNPLGGDALAALASSDPRQRTPAAMIAAFVRASIARPR